MEENTKDKFSELEEVARVNPLALLTIKDPTSLQVANSLLPFSTGIEIECVIPKGYIDNFSKIPKIVTSNIGFNEVRFRIPRGINGLICLYLICEGVKATFELDPTSGNHYHVDMRDIYQNPNISSKLNDEFIDTNREWILNELDKWEYKGKYNSREVRNYKGGWLGFRVDKGTGEFRCGEQSFDYTYLIDKIIHANDIIKRIKVLLNPEYIVPYFDDQLVTIEEIKSFYSTYCGTTKEKLNQIKIKQEELRKQQVTVLSPNVVSVDMMAIIKARINKKV